MSKFLNWYFLVKNIISSWCDIAQDWDWDWPRISCSISENDDMFQNCFNFIINFVKAVLSECIFNRLFNFKVISSLKNQFLSVSIDLKIVSYDFMSRSACPYARSSPSDLLHKIVFYTYWFRFQVYLFQWDKIEYRLLMNTSKTLKRLFKNPHI